MRSVIFVRLLFVVVLQFGGFRVFCDKMSRSGWKSEMKEDEKGVGEKDGKEGKESRIPCNSGEAPTKNARSCERTVPRGRHMEISISCLPIKIY